ncbi:MAG: D-aminoacyl-tRNA deacylase [Gammaproteobacteria bacterium]
MKVIIQRVSQASVAINSKVQSSIKRGILAYVCFEEGDNEESINKFFEKITKYKIFEGDSGILDTNLKQLGGEILIISQFTLNAVTKKGLKASYHLALEPSKAEKLYEHMIKISSTVGLNVFFGSFGAMMQVSSVNEGPYTLNFNF